MEYTSKGVGNAALATGIIGTTLGALDGMGGLAGILGDRRQSMNPEDRPVTRYEIGLIRDSIAKDNEIAILKAQQYADQINVGVQAQIAGQNAWNAAQMVNIQNIQNLLGKLVQPCIPNSSLTPGYGQAQVYPVIPDIVKAAATATNTNG